MNKIILKILLFAFVDAVSSGGSSGGGMLDTVSSGGSSGGGMCMWTQ